MVPSVYESMRDVFHVIERARSRPDPAAFLGDTLSCISKALHAPQAIAGVQDGDFARPRFVLRNVDREHLLRYLERYYLLDPFRISTPPANHSRLTLGPGHEKGVVRLEEDDADGHTPDLRLSGEHRGQSRNSGPERPVLPP